MDETTLAKALLMIAQVYGVSLAELGELWPS